LNIIKNINWS